MSQSPSLLYQNLLALSQQINIRIEELEEMSLGHLWYNLFSANKIIRVDPLQSSTPTSPIQSANTERVKTTTPTLDDVLEQCNHKKLHRFLSEQIHRDYPQTIDTSTSTTFTLIQFLHEKHVDVQKMIAENLDVLK